MCVEQHSETKSRIVDKGVNIALHDKKESCDVIGNTKENTMLTKLSVKLWTGCI